MAAAIGLKTGRPVAVVCARAYYVIFEWSAYKDDLLSIFNLRRGGLAIYGGVLGGALAVFDTTPPVPDDLQGLTWIEANNIEKILEDVDMLITNMMLAWYYAGDIYTGEV